MAGGGPLVIAAPVAASAELFFSEGLKTLLTDFYGKTVCSPCGTQSYCTVDVDEVLAVVHQQFPDVTTPEALADALRIALAGEVAPAQDTDISAVSLTFDPATGEITSSVTENGTTLNAVLPFQDVEFATAADVNPVLLRADFGDTDMSGFLSEAEVVIHRTGNFAAAMFRFRFQNIAPAVPVPMDLNTSMAIDIQQLGVNLGLFASVDVPFEVFGAGVMEPVETGVSDFPGIGIRAVINPAGELILFGGEIDSDGVSSSIELGRTANEISFYGNVQFRVS